MQKLVFINGSGNEIDLTSGNFGITNWEGLSNVPLNIQTQQVPFEDGGVFLDALMEQREIEVTVAIYDGNNLELRYQKKRELISALNPKLGEGTLIYTNDYLSRQIKAVPQIPLFENKNSNDAGTLKASVAFSCPNPYWEDLEESEIEIGADPTLVVNDGDIPVGFELNVIPSDNNNIRFNSTQSEQKIEVDDNQLNYTFKVSTLEGKKIVERISYPIEEHEFTGLSTGDNIEPYGIVYSKELDLWIGVSSNHIYKSSDCINWTSVYTFTNPMNKIKAIWNGNKFFAFCHESSTCYCVVSTDAENFIQTDITSSITSIEDCTVDETTKEVYCCGVGIVKTSDGINFTQEAQNNYEFICYNQVTGEILAGDNKNELYLKKAGVWVQQDPLEEGNTNKIEFCFAGLRGEYIFGGFWSGIWRVTPTIKLVSYQDTYGAEAGLYYHINNLYYTTGLIPFSSNSFLWQSSDGDNWIKTYYGNFDTELRKFIEKDNKLYIIGTGNNMYIMQGEKNIIDKLSADSNLNMKVEIGNNYFFKTALGGDLSNTTMTLKFRKKYIGV